MTNPRAEIAAALEVLRGQKIPTDRKNKNAWKEPIIAAVLPLLADVWDSGRHHGYGDGIDGTWEDEVNPYR